MWVTMMDRENRRQDRDGDLELFPDLTDECSSVILARFDLSSREFPLAGDVCARVFAALNAENIRLGFNDGRYHLDMLSLRADHSVNFLTTGK